MKKTPKIIAVFAAAAISLSAQPWTDISTSLTNQVSQPRDPKGCSGIAVNRLTGDIYTGLLWVGLWKSVNQGQNWTQQDHSYFTGNCNNNWALQVDQDNPVRMVAFSLDGPGAYTPDGTNWIKMTYQGRGWDFGSVDWSDPQAKVMLVPQHESGGLVFKTTDGGQTWNQLSVNVNATGGGSSANAMLGVIDANTFVCCSGSGIMRSTDQGSTWSKVSSANPISHVPVKFKGAFYLGTAGGMLVSKDKGATWAVQGASISFYQGPFFGSDENTMVVVGAQGVYKSTNAGTSWTKISSLYPNSQFDPSWFGCYSWDPVNNIVYACRMTFPAYKNQIVTTAVQQVNQVSIDKNRVTCNSNYHLGQPAPGMIAYSISGKVISRQQPVLANEIAVSK
jgi:photosystem II stability/assembly factor-like uncharacterized protein